MLKLQEKIINEFWEWVLKHQDNGTVVDHDTEGNLCIWIDFEDLSDFTDLYIEDAEQQLYPALLSDCVCIEVHDFLGGYGFAMDDVWEHKPIDLGQ